MCVQPINEWMEIRRKWDQYVTRMDAGRLVISRKEDLEDALKEDGAT